MKNTKSRLTCKYRPILTAYKKLRRAIRSYVDTYFGKHIGFSFFSIDPLDDPPLSVLLHTPVPLLLDISYDTLNEIVGQRYAATILSILHIALSSDQQPKAAPPIPRDGAGLTFPLTHQALGG
jgi:hypothetical protein